jgi:hypothetical protein
MAPAGGGRGPKGGRIAAAAAQGGVRSTAVGSAGLDTDRTTSLADSFRKSNSSNSSRRLRSSNSSVHDDNIGESRGCDDPPKNEESSGGGGSSSSSSASSDWFKRNASPEGGFGRVNHRLRSVLFHPLGLPLVGFFLRDDEEADDNNDQDNDDPAALCKQRVRKLLPHVDEAFIRWSRSDAMDEVLRESYEEYRGAVDTCKRQNPKVAAPPTQEDLTRICHRRISTRLKHASLVALHRHSVDCSARARSNAVADLLILRDDERGNSSSSSSNSKKAIVLLLDVALDVVDPDWWSNADQAVQFLQALLDPMNEASGAQFSGPALLAVLSIKTANGLDDVSLQSAHLGVFLCVPATGSRPCPDFRMALVWREMFSSLDNASKGMGKTLRAASALADVMANPGGMGVDMFQYLGPNCCRINDKVRIRLACTNRSARIL